jgi:hypothetical protein
MSGSPVPSVRHKRRTPFVIVESATVRDTTLKYTDLGLLTFLLDQDEDWQVRSEQLSRGEGREGREAIRKSLHRLAARGYYRLERRRLRTGEVVMGTAVSDHRVEQWAADYVTFGQKLAIPMVQQEDGSFRVKYPDGTLGSDGFDTAAAQDADAEPPAERPPVQTEPEQTALTPPPAQPTTSTATPKRTAAPTKAAQKKAVEAAEKAAQDKALDEAAHKVATWWWDLAETHLGKYAGQRGAFVAVRQMIRRSLAVGYTQQQCAKALQHARKHWPSAQQWQEALGVASNHIAPKQPHGRIPYSDATTWGDQGAGQEPTAATPPDDDDATFGIVT